MITFLLYLIAALFTTSAIYLVFEPRIKGKVGETKITSILNRLDRSKYSVINDIVLKVRDNISQIDHVVISDSAIFVIETKNFKGWIFGGEDSEFWTQVLYQRKEKLYNPIRQNRGHIHALKHLLKDYPNLKYIPIVVFCSKATLKVNTVSAVTYSYDLLKLIKGYDEIALTQQEKKKIADRINAANVRAKYNRKQHIKMIRQKVTERAESISRNKCSRCGGELKSRTGKFGHFTGCTNYPKCRFTLNNGN